MHTDEILGASLFCQAITTLLLLIQFAVVCVFCVKYLPEVALACRRFLSPPEAPAPTAWGPFRPPTPYPARTITPPPSYAAAVGTSLNAPTTRPPREPSVAIEMTELPNATSYEAQGARPRRPRPRLRTPRYVNYFICQTISHVISHLSLIVFGPLHSLHFIAPFSHSSHMPTNWDKKQTPRSFWRDAQTSTFAGYSSTPVSVFLTWTPRPDHLYPQLLKITVRHYITHFSYITMALPKVHLPTYSSADVVEWDNFKKVYNTFLKMLPADTNDTQKKGYLLCNISGQAASKAADYFQYVDDNTKTPAWLLTQLTNIFAPAASGDLAMSLWHNAKQETNETIESWHTRAKQLYSRAFPDDDANTSKHLIHGFISHLFHNDYKPSILLKRPTTYRDALQAAQEVVAALSVNNPRLAFDAAGGNLQATPQIKQEAVQSLTTPSIQSLTMPADQPSVSAIQRPFSRSPTPAPPAGNPSVTCHFCQKTGHIVRYCALLSRARDFLRDRSASRNRFQARQNRANTPPPNSRSGGFNTRGRSPNRRSQSPGRVSFNTRRPQVYSLTHAQDLDQQLGFDTDSEWTDFLNNIDNE